MLRSVVEILEKHNPEALRLQDMYDLLLLQLDKAEVLRIKYGKHPLTAQIAMLHKKRLKSAAFINTQLESFKKIDFEENQLNVKLAQLSSKEFITYLGQKRQIFVGLYIGSFFSELELDSRVATKEAFADLGLQPYLDDLEKTNNLHRQLSMQRSLDIDDRPQTSDRVLERETEGVMRMFFEQVTSFRRLFKEINYLPLINELNETLTAYSKTIKTRIATNKRRAKKKKALATKAQTETDAKTNVKSKAEPEAKPTTSAVVKPIDGGSVPDNINGTDKNKEKENTRQAAIKGASQQNEIPNKELGEDLKQHKKKKK